MNQDSSREGERKEQSENGFYCEVCDCIVKDSLNYLDHVNGKRHNRNLGISLKKFTDSTLEEVKEMLEFKKRERDEKLLGYSIGEKDEDYEEKWRQRKREKRKRQKANRAGKSVEGDDDDDERNSDDDDEEDTLDQNSGEDEMAKLMGFSSFSSTKK